MALSSFPLSSSIPLFRTNHDFSCLKLLWLFEYEPKFYSIISNLNLFLSLKPSSVKPKYSQWLTNVKIIFHFQDIRSLAYRSLRNSSCIYRAHHCSTNTASDSIHTTLNLFRIPADWYYGLQSHLRPKDMNRMLFQ